MIFHTPQIGFKEPKYSLGIQCVYARRSQADYTTILPAHHAVRLGNVSLDTPKVVLEIHQRLTQRGTSPLTRGKSWPIAANLAEIPEFCGARRRRDLTGIKHDRVATARPDQGTYWRN